MNETHWTKYPENEWTVYIWTVNSWYYKDPDKGIDDMLTDAEVEAEEAHMFMILASTSNLVTNIIRWIWL